MKSLKPIIVVMLFMTCLHLSAQKGKTFPILEGKNLEGSLFSLPLVQNTKSTLVCLVYSPKTEKALNSWLQPLVNTFLVKNPLDPEPYDINMYFVIMLSGIKNLASDAIETKLKKGISKDFYKNIIIYQGPLNPYTSVLDFGKKDEPYFCVLDQNGIIQSNTVGEYNAAKLEEIENSISK